MSCTNPFCTCCHRAYWEGLQDGCQLGYRRGFTAGYIKGYVDAARQLSPPEEVRFEIQTRLQPYGLTAPGTDYTNPLNLLPKSRRRSCTCVGVCVCGNR